MLECLQAVSLTIGVSAVQPLSCTHLQCCLFGADLCHFAFPMDQVPELSSYLELVFDADVTVTEVSNVPPCLMKQVARCHWKAGAVQCDRKHLTKTG